MLRPTKSVISTKQRIRALAGNEKRPAGRFSRWYNHPYQALRGASIAVSLGFPVIPTKDKEPHVSFAAYTERMTMNDVKTVLSKTRESADGVAVVGGSCLEDHDINAGKEKWYAAAVDFDEPGLLEKVCNKIHESDPNLLKKLLLTISSETPEGARGHIAFLYNQPIVVKETFKTEAGKTKIEIKARGPKIFVLPGSKRKDGGKRKYINCPVEPPRITSTEIATLEKAIQDVKGIVEPFFNFTKDSGLRIPRRAYAIAKKGRVADKGGDSDPRKHLYASRSELVQAVIQCLVNGGNTSPKTVRYIMIELLKMSVAKFEKHLSVAYVENSVRTAVRIRKTELVSKYLTDLQKMSRLHVWSGRGGCSERLLYDALLDEAVNASNTRVGCSTYRLGRVIGKDRMSVSRILSRLEKKGFINLIKFSDKKGKGHAHHCDLLLPISLTCHGVGGHPFNTIDLQSYFNATTTIVENVNNSNVKLSLMNKDVVVGSAGAGHYDFLCFIEAQIAKGVRVFDMSYVKSETGRSHTWVKRKFMLLCENGLASEQKVGRKAVWTLKNGTTVSSVEALLGEQTLNVAGRVRSRKGSYLKKLSRLFDWYATGFFLWLFDVFLKTVCSFVLVDGVTVTDDVLYISKLERCFALVTKGVWSYDQNESVGCLFSGSSIVADCI